MIELKNAKEIALMREAGRLTAQCMELVSQMVRPGITTQELDRAAEDFITKHNAVPSFKGYRGYPASICASIDEEVVHGIPGPRKLEEGQIIGIDLGVILNGYNGDMARTFAIGEISDEKQRLMTCAKDCFEAAMSQMVVGNRLGDMGYAAQSLVEGRGFSVVRDLCGHGIGKKMHEDPEVPNFGMKGRGVRLRSGMTLAVEPMVNAGTFRVNILDDGWTIVTADLAPSAHYENTVLITDGEPVILTAL